MDLGKSRWFREVVGHELRCHEIHHRRFPLLRWWNLNCLGGKLHTWQPCVSETTCNLRYVGMLGDFFAKCFLWWDWLINQAFFGRNMLGTFSDRWSLIFAWIPRVISMVIWKVSSKCAKTWFSWYSSDRLKSSTGIIRWFFLYLRLENMQCFCRVSILSQEILAKPQDIGAYGYKYKQYGFVYTYMYITTYIFVYIDTYMLQTRVQTFVFQTKPVWKLMLLFTWMRWRHKICQTINLISRYLTRFNKSAHVEETPRTSEQSRCSCTKTYR